MTTPLDLPLFAWKSPTADVVPFPAAKRIGKIRRTAQLVVESTERAATAHWKRTISDMTRHLERAGIPSATIDAEIEAFKNAVGIAIARRTRGSMRLNLDDGGAA